MYISINAMGFSFAPTNFLLLLYNLKEQFKKKNINCSLFQDRQVMFFPSILQKIVLLYPGSDIFILYASYNTSECSAMRILYQSLLLPHALRNSRLREPIRSDVKPQCSAFPGWQEVNRPTNAIKLSTRVVLGFA